MRGWIVIAGLAGAASVALGAYGAHGLASDPYAQGLAERSSQYLIMHALAVLVVVGLRHLGLVGRCAQLACAFFVLGMVMFCGSLALKAVGGVVLPVPMVTPLGGVFLIMAWLMVVVSAIYRKSCGAGHGSV